MLSKLTLIDTKKRQSRWIFEPGATVDGARSLTRKNCRREICKSQVSTLELSFSRTHVHPRDFGDERAVEVWSEHLQRTSDVEEKFILYKLLIELYEERKVALTLLCV